MISGRTVMQQAQELVVAEEVLADFMAQYKKEFGFVLKVGTKQPLLPALSCLTACCCAATRHCSRRRQSSCLYCGSLRIIPP